MAQSGHPNGLNQCPLLGVKRTLGWRGSMSVIDPKRTWLPRSAVDPHRCARRRKRVRLSWVKGFRIKGVLGCATIAFTPSPRDLQKLATSSSRGISVLAPEDLRGQKIRMSRSASDQEPSCPLLAKLNANRLVY